MLKVITYPFLVLWGLMQLVPFTLLMILACVFQAHIVNFTWKLK